ncbi:MAG: DNA integrity scanning diadenylate cyclase DisA [Fusobacteriaceae bacterium]
MNRDSLLEIISQVTPGTALREGIFNILEGGRGGLVVVGFNEEIKQMLDGGFLIDCKYTPEKIFELAKMDGAIIIDESVEKIYYANVHLHPERTFLTTESGTRHRTAQRMALQTNKLVIAISERKKSVTLYKGENKYRLKSISVVIEQATQALKTLEKYRHVLDNSLANLTILELDDLVTIHEISFVLQRFEMVYRIKKELKGYVTELGTDGRLMSLQMHELFLNVKEEKTDFIKDYSITEKKDFTLTSINDELEKLTDKELLELERFSQILGYGKTYSSLDNKVVSKGYRVLNKISKLTKKDIDKIISTYDNLTDLQEATAEELSEIKGISKFKIKAIQSGLKKVIIELGNKSFREDN